MGSLTKAWDFYRGQIFFGQINCGGGRGVFYIGGLMTRSCQGGGVSQMYFLI